MKLLTVVLLLLYVVPDAKAVVIADYDPTVNDRFASGYPTSPVLNTSSQFVGSAYDFSGVGWNPNLSTQSFAMISDQYFVYATHYGHGDSISFLSPSLYTANPSTAVVTLAVDTSFSFTPILTATGQPGDLSIGRLAAPISASLGIASYPILDLGSPGNYVGLPLLVYGHGASAADSPRIGTNVLDGTGAVDIFPTSGGDNVADTLEFYYSYAASNPGEAGLEGGDSGSPTFTIWDGGLALLGTHSGIDNATPQNSYDTFIPHYINQMAADNITFTTVPEPSTAALVTLSLGTALWRRRRPGNAA